MKLKKLLVSALATATVVSTMSFGAFATSDSASDASTDAASYTAFLMFQDDSAAWSSFDQTKTADTNAEFTGDGTYTVSMTAEEVGATAMATSAQVFCVDIVGLAQTMTDAGLVCNNYDRDETTGAFSLKEDQSTVDVKISDVKVEVDGTEVTVNPDRIYYGDIEEKGTFRIDISNEWGPTGTTPAVNDDDICPEKELKVTFTISGTGIGTPLEVTEAPTATPEITEAPTATPEVTDAATTAPAASDKATLSDNADDDSNNTGLIVGIVIAVVVVAGVIVAVAMKKKKEN